MSGSIQILPDSLINQIAAGEVVERPASVVKELLENAVDAGAVDIQVDILQSGRSLIRVTDNGLGMNKEDLVLAVERHATSKIKAYADLISLRSMGFRGEALPSIASVSRMTILSTSRDETFGHRLEIWGGKKISLEEVGGTPGTTVEVLDLFYNTPARMAFLKSPKAEWNQIQWALERVALGFPSLRFDLTHNGKKIFQLFPSSDNLLRLRDLWGPDKIEELIPVDLEENLLRVYGFISPPHRHLNQARNIAFIVNQRWVRSPLLYPLLLRSYAGMIPSGRFPVAALWLEVPPELIDVNIHPFKQEVRFSQSTWIQNLVAKAIGQALKSAVPKTMPIGSIDIPNRWPQNLTQPLLFREADRLSFSSPLSKSDDSTGLTFSERALSVGDDLKGISEINRFSEPVGVNEGEEGFANLSILGQIQGTYIITLMNQGLILIDQHAAHERILFERYRSQWQFGGVSSQFLIIPILIELPPGESISPDSIVQEIAALGFELEAAGETGLWIKSIPVGMSPDQGEAALREILEELKTGDHSIDPADLALSLLKLMACHSAIRAGQTLNLEEIKALLVQLDQTESPSHCPHGRPLWILLSWEEIEKRFKRR